MVRRRTPRRPRWFMIALLVILGYFGSILVSQGLYLSHVHEDQRLASDRLAAAQAENDRLRAEKERLGELPYIEKLAREDRGRLCRLLGGGALDQYGDRPIGQRRVRGPQNHAEDQTQSKGETRPPTLPCHHTLLLETGNWKLKTEN